MKKVIEKFTGGAKLQLGVITEDTEKMNEVLGMYLQAEEVIYFLYIKEGYYYGFTNKAIIAKTPIENDTRDSVTRYPFTQYYVTNSEIKQGDKDLDVEVHFQLNRYTTTGSTSMSSMKQQIQLSIDKDLKEYAIIVYKMMALLQERQQEQKDLEKGMLEATKNVLDRSSHKPASLEEELALTKEWLLRQVYTTQFSNIHPMFEDALLGYVRHIHKETDGRIFDNVTHQFKKSSEHKHKKEEDIIDAEIIEN
ncbi:hypothetical protein ABD87_00305 [Lysinibacillus sphaericus]|uniref:hypothetical protein n=1 Tax=Lysinibacillus sphaericus TaxID=1421 RepID=UPI0018CEB935|nr:hypothetical protein [Lysinibacillus sphaericus]MBG9728030.1 hypothetical protein [Lysinibacillus sphaericus]